MLRPLRPPARRETDIRALSTSLVGGEGTAVRRGGERICAGREQHANRRESPHALAKDRARDKQVKIGLRSHMSPRLEIR